MATFELIVTLGILLAALAWAVRKFHRWVTRSSRAVESGEVSCQQSGGPGCGACPLITPPSDHLQAGNQPSDAPPSQPGQRELDRFIHEGP